MANVRLFEVAPGSTTPSRVQTKANGPVPDEVVEKLAVSPGHLTKSARGVLVASALRLRVAQLVTLVVELPHEPVTITQ